MYKTQGLLLAGGGEHTQRGSLCVWIPPATAGPPWGRLMPVSPSALGTQAAGQTCGCVRRSVSSLLGDAVAQQRTQPVGLS